MLGGHHNGSRKAARSSKWVASALNINGTNIQDRQVRNEASAGEATMIVKLKKPNSRYRDLTSGQLYGVIGIEADDLRIINDAGRPFLYPPDLFSLVDAREPADWVTEFGDDGERYSSQMQD